MRRHYTDTPAAVKRGLGSIDRAAANAFEGSWRGGQAAWRGLGTASHGTAMADGAAQRDLVGVLEVAAHRQAVGDAGDLQATLG